MIHSRGITTEYHTRQFEESFGKRTSKWEYIDDLNEFENFDEDNYIGYIHGNYRGCRDDKLDLLDLEDSDWKQYCTQYCEYKCNGKCMGRHYWCGEWEEDA